MKDNAVPKAWLTVTEAAAYCRCSKTVIYQYIASGQITSYEALKTRGDLKGRNRISRLISASDLDTLIREAPLDVKGRLALEGPVFS